MLISICMLLLPSAAPLVGMFWLGNLMNTCGVVERLSKTLQNERGVAIFAKACSWASCPNKQQKTTRPLLPSAASIRPAYVPATSHHRILDADSAALPQMTLRHVVMLCIFPPPALTHRLRKNTQPYSYRGLKIFTSLSSVSRIFSD